MSAPLCEKIQIFFESRAKAEADIIKFHKNVNRRTVGHLLRRGHGKSVLQE